MKAHRLVSRHCMFDLLPCGRGQKLGCLAVLPSAAKQSDITDEPVHRVGVWL